MTQSAACSAVGMTDHNVTPCVTLYTAVSRILECWTGPTIVTGTRADRLLGFTDTGRAVAIYAAPWGPTGPGE